MHRRTDLLGLSHSSLVSLMRSPTFFASAGINQSVLEPSSLNSGSCGVCLFISQVVFATIGRITTVDSLTSYLPELPLNHFHCSYSPILSASLTSRPILFGIESVLGAPIRIATL